MGARGFFKGERKKKKKELVKGNSFANTPTFILPKVVEKKKKAA